jgi:alpha-tubulin suppressor-like RCC1 family protein
MCSVLVGSQWAVSRRDGAALPRASVDGSVARVVPLRARPLPGTVVLLIASIAALVSACSSDKKPRPPVVQDPPPPGLPAPVTRTIDAGGGTIAGPNGITLTIPEGALKTATDITVAVDRAARRPDLPADFEVDDEAVVLTPHGTTFGVPVTIAIPFDPASAPAGTVRNLIKTNAAGGDVQQLVTVRDGTMLSAAITSFSNARSILCFPREPLGCSNLAFVRQPVGGSVAEGGSFQFEVEMVTTSPRPLSYQWVRGEDQVPIPNATNPTLLLQNITLAEEGVPYRVLVTLTDNDGQPFPSNLVSEPAVLRIAPARPRFVPDLADVQVAFGEDARFSVGIISAAPLTGRQWWRGTTDSNGGISWLQIPDAVNADYVLKGADADDDGARFRVIASNSSGAVESRIATLDVLPAPVQPTIRQQPQALSVTAGTSVVFTVRAEGGQLEYSWQRKEPVANATFVEIDTAATLTISNAALDDNGAEFRVVVSNPVGSVTSDVVKLTVGLARGQAVQRLSGGLRYSVGLRADGGLTSWGNNVTGQLGDGTRTTRTTPVEVLGLSRVAGLSVGVSHSLAVLDTGAVWAWGSREGLGFDADADTPVALADFGPGAPLGAARAAFANRASGFAYSLVLLDRGGQVWGFGRNVSGQLGDGTTIARARPVRVGSLTGVVSVAAGGGHALALLRDGTVYAWGANHFGQLGNGSLRASVDPIPIPMPAQIVAVFAGADSSYALDVDGTVWGWGRNSGRGVLGDVGSEDGRDDRLTPVRVLLPGPAVDVALGTEHAHALLADGRVFGWGMNDVGQCACGDPTAILRPQQVVTPPLPQNIRAIGAGNAHGLALEEDGDVWTWGSNELGQLSGGVNTRLGVHEPLAIQVPGVNLGALNASFTLTVAFGRSAGPEARLSATFATTREPAGINCTAASDPQGEDCRETYPAGTAIVVRGQLSDTADRIDWRNCPLEISPFECQVTMNADFTLVTE